MDNVTGNNLNQDIETHNNADPITQEPGLNPIGTAIGGSSGGVAGAALGSIGGPLGMLIGGAVGAVIGGVAGSSAVEILDPTVEYDYWRENYTTRPYYNADYDYEVDYHPAYTVGYASRVKYPKTTHFEDVESELEQRWQEVKGESRLDWLQAKEMVRDGWDKTDARMCSETYQPQSNANYAVHGHNIDKDKNKPRPVTNGNNIVAGIVEDN